MPYPNDRRKSHRAPDEALSPEYLAMLVVCGGEVRQSDLSALTGAVNERGQSQASRAHSALPAPSWVAKPDDRFDR